MAMAMANPLAAAMTVDASCAASISKLNQQHKHGGLRRKLVSSLDSKARRQEAPSLPALSLSASSNGKHTFMDSSSSSSASSLWTPDSTASVSSQSDNSIWSAKKGAPPIMPAIMTPVGPSDLSSLLLRNRIIFLGQTVNSQVAQRVISQLLMLAAIDEDTEIKVRISLEIYYHGS
ncbi:hypothetical protein O6H91_Y028800 [Diphasiastrum complanatum]|nr:hypothetical protein O6H91_Y028800 [Diphasiastrum complanatum]